MTDPKILAQWGSIVVSVLASLAFVVAMLIAWKAGDQAAMAILMGVVAGGFNTVIGYWLGSSAGSAKKDEAIAAAAVQRSPPS